MEITMHLSIWDIMAPAFFECLILVGIHSYLGLHVIKRKVIFVDLALAQVAALGTTVGFLFGILPGTSGAYWFSLGFAILGAAIFSLLRFRHEKIPQEAVIGLVYALAAATAILVIDKAPHGAEHIKDLLTGSILWVKWTTIRNAAIVYAAVGLFHYIFRDKFLLISDHPEEAYRRGLSVRFWDFLFYVSFGIVITHSVGTAGVLLVFVFLVVPAITSIMITDVLWKQLAIGWSMGLVVSVLGLYISYIADLPSGPTVVAFYGAMLLLVALILFVVKAPSRGRALLKIAFGTGITIIVVFFFRLLGEYFHTAEHRQERQRFTATASRTLHDPEKTGPVPSSLNEKYILQLTNIDSLKLFFHKSDDYSLRLDIARRMEKLNPKDGIGALLSLLRTCPFSFLREEIISEIEKYSHERFGYDSSLDAAQNAPAFHKLKIWYENRFN